MVCTHQPARSNVCGEGRICRGTLVVYGIWLTVSHLTPHPGIGYRIDQQRARTLTALYLSAQNYLEMHLRAITHL